MKAIVVSSYVEGPSDLTVSDVSDPVPAENQYLIRIYSTATNFFDVLQARGKYQTQPPFPWVAGFEFAGVIEKAPSALPAPRFQIGDRVFGGRQGAYATKIAVSEESLSLIPDGWSFSQAASLFTTAPTSYAALVNRAGCQAGDWVLIHAAAGGVGLAAVQIAKGLGTNVIALADTSRKLEIVKEFGADFAVRYEDDWPSVVKKITPNERGVDIVFDPIGLIDKSTKCIAWKGRLIVIGFAGGTIEKVAMNKVLLKNIAIMGLWWGRYAVEEPETVRSVWDSLYGLIMQGKYRGIACTDRRFVGLEEVPKALLSLGGDQIWGKLVVDLPQLELAKI
ncbi:Alcohol dehydrogenase GroES-like domain-containing protein [Cladophialophora immunda]|nr:Alcohol dehydrogenase GroES-like domain-containing protein [Cladophialophora immunda]